MNISEMPLNKYLSRAPSHSPPRTRVVPLASSRSLPVAEVLRENKRMLDRAIRDIERERQQLQAQEKKLILEIKKTAKQGQMVRPSAPLTSPAFVLLGRWRLLPSTLTMQQGMAGQDKGKDPLEEQNF